MRKVFVKFINAPPTGLTYSSARPGFSLSLLPSKLSYNGHLKACDVNTSPREGNFSMKCRNFGRQEWVACAFPEEILKRHTALGTDFLRCADAKRDRVQERLKVHINFARLGGNFL